VKAEAYFCDPKGAKKPSRGRQTLSRFQAKRRNILSDLCHKALRKSKLLCFFSFVKAEYVASVERATMSRGRKHLVDFKRSEEIYLVICDHTNLAHEVHH